MQDNEEIINEIDEQDEYEENKKKIYKINIGDTILVRRTDLEKEGQTYSFYFTTIVKKEFNAKRFYKKTLKFKKGTVIKDMSRILIKDMFEDAMMNKNDKYNPIWCLVILDYEVVEEPEYETKHAILDYQQTIKETKDEEDLNDLITF